MDHKDIQLFCGGGDADPIYSSTSLPWRATKSLRSPAGLPLNVEQVRRHTKACFQHRSIYCIWWEGKTMSHMGCFIDPDLWPRAFKFGKKSWFPAPL